MLPSLSIIVLNWNGWEDTLECLESLYQINYPNYNIIIVDNCSEDSSIEKIEDYCNDNLKVKSDFLKSNVKKPIEIFECVNNEFENIENDLKNFRSLKSSKKLLLIKNDKNYGFAEGNNIGMNFVFNYLESDYVLLLNNDTIVDANFLDELVKVGERSTKIGCVGPKIYYYDFKGLKNVISFAGEKINLYTSLGKRFGNKKIDNGQYDVLMETDKVEGCCMLLKTDVIKEVGVFDPVYFAYWEETDLCMRIHNKGFKLLYVPKSVIWHKIGMNWSNYFSYFVIYHYLVRNRLIFIWRYASNLQKICFTPFFSVYLLINIITMFIREDLKTSKEGLNAIKDGIKDFKNIKSS